jgi:hypothetical protein
MEVISKIRAMIKNKMTRILVRLMMTNHLRTQRPQPTMIKTTNKMMRINQSIIKMIKKLIIMMTTSQSMMTKTMIIRMRIHMMNHYLILTMMRRIITKKNTMRKTIMRKSNMKKSTMMNQNLR